VVAAQTYLEAFANGIRAVDQQRWAEAARQMQIAATARPDTGDNTRVYGTRFESYLPNYFLAVALYESKDFAAAVQAFNKAEQLGGVKKNNGYYSRLRRLRDDAQSKAQVAGTPPAAAPPRTATLPPTPPPAPDNSPAALPSRPPAGGVMTAPPLPAAAAAPRPAAPSAAVIAAAEDSLQRATADRDAVNRIQDFALLRQLDAALARADTAARATLSEAGSRLESGRRGNAGDLERVPVLSRQAATEFQQVTQLAAAAVTRITNDLIAATAPYFAGDYAGARTALERLAYPGGRFAAQWRLFRAASAYALYVTSGQRDEALRAEAETNARECRRLAGSAFKPDPRVFSPRFIEFFNARS
jgi:hypothetical protein